MLFRSRDNFKEAIIGLFKQKVLPNGNTTMQSNPRHFLSHFESYLTAYHDKNMNLYGENKYKKVQVRMKESLIAELNRSGDPRIVGPDKDIFDSYKRYSPMREFPKPAQKNNRK